MDALFFARPKTEETIENLFQVLLRNSRAIIAHANDGRLSFMSY